jgi:UDP-N-acetylmuramoyl-L-alanyl-D-glutamate--2,6-diaminopimelate ligase
MDLQILLSDIAEKAVSGPTAAIDIKGVVYDPLRVQPGYLFVAINIYTQLDKIEIPDGHPLVAEAIQRGAVAVVLQKDQPVPDHVAKILVPDSRQVLGLIATRFYGFPSDHLNLIAVTGTNGKTTTTHVVESIFIQKYRIGLIGTLYYKMNGVIHKSKDTTPEPPDLQDILRRMADEKSDYCVMETSSHGIEFFRLTGCQFKVAVFTNLTQDHLDFHHTMENYLNAKLKLFRWLKPKDFAIINIDDSYGHHFVMATQARVISYGLSPKADVRAERISYHIKGTSYRLVTPTGEIDIDTKLVGRFNVYNALAAVAVAISQNIDLQTIKAGLEAKIWVSGRFELVERGQEFAVVVDYAHTPDGMENVLSLAKSLNPKRVITLFGCGGDRDKEKRPIMGEMADRYSDELIITADNPRNEDPAQIIEEISRGCRTHSVHKILDRREAIRYAVRMAQPGDIVMILGKGHETTQTLRERTIEFNDRIESEKALQDLATQGPAL